MKKSVKVALKRFVVLLICLLMVMSLFASIDKIEQNTKVIIGTICIVCMIIYWVYAIISIRRHEQLKKRKGK
jgi:antibiotic biosynthesis monooxygenase (ABM) superfamily enzyme